MTGSRSSCRIPDPMPVIRRATPDDRTEVEAIVHATYSVYVDRIGKPPGPMLDDYGRLIADGAVSVFAAPDGVLAGLIVLVPASDHLLLDNVAVRPERQGEGIGRRLIAFAESEACRLGYRELRLYTHEKMSENIAVYLRLGFAETGRGRQAAYDPVFMTQRLR